jgi:hypothetical protein
MDANNGLNTYYQLQYLVGSLFSGQGMIILIILCAIGAIFGIGGGSGSSSGTSGGFGSGDHKFHDLWDD